MDQVHLLVDEHMKYLQRVQPKAILVAKIMKQRNDLIQVGSSTFFSHFIHLCHHPCTRKWSTLKRMHRIQSDSFKLHSNCFKKNDGVTAVFPTCSNWMMLYLRLYENSSTFQANHSSMANVDILTLWYVFLFFYFPMERVFVSLFVFLAWWNCGSCCQSNILWFPKVEWKERQEWGSSCQAIYGQNSIIHNNNETTHEREPTLTFVFQQNSSFKIKKYQHIIHSIIIIPCIFIAYQQNNSTTGESSWRQWYPSQNATHTTCRTVGVFLMNNAHEGNIIKLLATAIFEDHLALLRFFALA